MDDSFGRLARKIRQNKIDKRQLRNIKKEVIEVNMKKTEKNKMATYIQKITRGFLSRKKFNVFLQKINVETIIEYLHDKKKARIHEHNKEIISFFILKYINKERKKISIQKKKEESINLIKARLRGIIARKKFKAKINLRKRSKKKMLKYILSFKIRLILSCNEIQEILSDIAEIKNSLKNIDKQNDKNNKNQNIKDLKTKLNKSLNSFYVTFYKIKDNSEWTTQNKTDQPWISKYMEILKKDNNDTDKNSSNNYNNIVYVNSNKKGSYSISKANKSVGQTQYLQIKIKPKKYLGVEDRNKILESKKSELIENKSNITNNTINTNITNNDTTNNEKNDVLKFDEEQDEFAKKNNNEDENKIKVNKSKNTAYIYNKKNSNSIINNNTNNDSSNFITTESINDESNINKKNNNEIETNNNKNERAPKYNRNNYAFEEELENNDKENNKKTSLDENKYHQRDERPIKPLNTNNFLNTDNPFGNRRGSKINPNAIINNLNNNQKNNDNDQIKNAKTFKESLPEKSKTKVDIPILKDTNSNISTDENRNNKYNQYDNRPCGGNLNYNEIFNNNSKKGEERPLGGSKNINYNEMFKDDNFNEFSGDPFGGAKQFESKNKKNINNNNNENNKKKPVYDARKAIEEAKIKEAKEGGKKEKPSAFREFLKEMRKINAEEKNEKTKNEEDKKENDNKKVTSSQSVKKRNAKKIQNEKTENGNNLKNDIINTEDNKSSKNKPNPKFKKEPETKEIALRKKLHELEKAPAPMLNIKGVKSRIECWGIDNTRNKVSPSKNKEKEVIKKTPTNASSNNNKNDQLINPKDIDEFISIKKQKQINKEETDDSINQKAIDEFINMKKQRQMNSNTNINKVNNKAVEEKIEKYVDKKLLQLNIQIEEIDDIFNLEDYFKEKDIKMKKFYSIPYIKEEFDFVQNYNIDDYENLISKIQDKYKELK